MDLTGATWRKASSGAETDGTGVSDGTGASDGIGVSDEASVEIAFVPGSKEGSEQIIAMRDSRQPDGPVLIFTPDEWRAFTAGVQDGEFDLA